MLAAKWGHRQHLVVERPGRAVLHGGLCSSKAGLIGFTKALALELGRGHHESTPSRQAWSSPDAQKAIAEGDSPIRWRTSPQITPVRRADPTEDIANADVLIA